MTQFTAYDSVVPYARIWIGCSSYEQEQKMTAIQNYVRLNILYSLHLGKNIHTACKFRTIVNF